MTQGLSASIAAKDSAPLLPFVDSGERVEVTYDDDSTARFYVARNRAGLLVKLVNRISRVGAPVSVWEREHLRDVRGLGIYLPGKGGQA
jgi:hypothetical protein